MFGKDGPKSSMSSHSVDMPMTAYCQSIKEYKQQQGNYSKKSLFFLNFKDFKRIRHFFFRGLDTGFFKFDDKSTNYL